MQAVFKALFRQISRAARRAFLRLLAQAVAGGKRKLDFGGNCYIIKV